MFAFLALPLKMMRNETDDDFAFKVKITYCRASG